MLRDALRSLALLAARRLVLPELAAALDAREVRTWGDLLDTLALLAHVDRRLGPIAEERDALRDDLAQHHAALEEVRRELDAARRDRALVLAQREAQATLADQHRRQAEELDRRRLRALAAARGAGTGGGELTEALRQMVAELMGGGR